MSQISSKRPHSVVEMHKVGKPKCFAMCGNPSSFLIKKITWIERKTPQYGTKKQKIQIRCISCQWQAAKTVHLSLECLCVVIISSHIYKKC